MKYLIKMIVAIFLLLIPEAGTQAFQNEPNGFRDMYWGESLQEIEENYNSIYGVYDKELNSVSYYIFINDKEISGVTSLGMIEIKLWNNQLFEVSIPFNGGNNQFGKLNNAMLHLYGLPSYSRENWKEWWGENTSIRLYRVIDKRPYGVEIVIQSNELSKKAIEDGASKGW